MRALSTALLSTLLGLTACDGCGNDRPDFCPGCYDSDANTDDTGPIETGPIETGIETGETGDDPVVDYTFDDPGDYAIIDSEEGEEEITVALTDSSGDDNREQEFYAIFVNGSGGTSVYDMWYSVTAEESRSARPQPTPQQVADHRLELKEQLAERTRSVENRPPPPPPPDLAVGDTDVFRVRDDMSDESSFYQSSATLVALGETVAIWVETSVGLDWDTDCDGVIDEYDTNPSYGFDNCDLETIAGIVDTNIMVNLEALMGDFSDINGDDRVTVLITPVLNNLPQSSDDPDDHAAVFESYADPAVDLEEYDLDENPVSDEQEIIYVFAPDPHGYYNSDFTTTVEAYTSLSLAAQIAAETVHLIVYNQKVLEQAGTDEDTWLMQGLGAVAADICGFGAIYFDDAWDYLDAPHLYGLTTEVEGSGLSLEGRGAQYLFLRWLVDVHGTDILAELVQSEEIGVDNVVAAVQNLGGDVDGFADIVLQWQVAMLTTGVTDVDGNPLMETEGNDWPLYGEAEFITAPTEPPEKPAVGTYYGANGYQRGINIGGENLYMEGGTTDAPYENEALRVTLGNTDFATIVPAYEFAGAYEGGYAASVVRMPVVPYEDTTLYIQPGGEDFAGVVIRWNDPESSDLMVEEIFSSSVTTSVALPAVPEDGSPVYGVGAIGEPWTISSYDHEGVYSDQEFFDTDRWTLDLTDRAMGSQVQLHIWLDRQYEPGTYDIAPYDPWLAVVPTDYVPTPDETNTPRASCTHDEGIDFAYPTSILDYLFLQEVLSEEPLGSASLNSGSGSGSGTSKVSDFDACGEPPPDTGAEEPDCSNDWDSDGVLDADEPRPDSFYQQVLVKMCTLDPDLLEAEVWGLEWFDADTLDEDESATVDRILNSGGLADDSGEGAFLSIELEGGQSYQLIVSGGSDQGTYELTVREIPQ